jgi:hypothetical protein
MPDLAAYFGIFKPRIGIVGMRTALGELAGTRAPAMESFGAPLAPPTLLLTGALLDRWLPWSGG